MRTEREHRRREQAESWGFTLVEIMVALVILSMGIVTIVSLQRANVRSAVHGKQLTVATMLARSVMVEAYLKNYKKELSKAIKEEHRGETEMGDLKLKWEWSLHDVPLQIPERVEEEEEVQEEKGEESPDYEEEPPQRAEESEEEENPFLIPIIRSVNDFISNALRELSVRVSWDTTFGEKEIYYVTHLVDFSYPIQIPKIPMPQEGAGQ